MGEDKQSLSSRVGVGVITAYQTITHLFYHLLAKAGIPKICKYEPTCSKYAQEAIKKHGLARGSLKGLGRILRCNPWSKGGFNPLE